MIGQTTDDKRTLGNYTYEYGYLHLIYSIKTTYMPTYFLLIVHYIKAERLPTRQFF